MMVYVDEDTINAVDEQLCEDDSEFAAILTNYSEVRGALSKPLSHVVFILWWSH